MSVQCISYIGMTLYWNVTEAVNAASTTIPRVFEPTSADLMKANVQSPHLWIENWLEPNKITVSEAIDAGLKSMQGLTSTDGQKFPSIVGLVNMTTEYELPKPFVGKPVKKVFLRIAEVGTA